MQNDKFLQYLHLHGIVFIWGFTAVLGALISINAIPLVWYRMLLASGFIGIYLVYKKIPLRVSAQSLLQFFVVGAIIALHWLCFFGAIKVSNVSVTLAIMSSGAFFASFLEPIFHNRKIIYYEVFFGLLVVVGLYVIFTIEKQYLTGILLALASTFFGALFSVLNGLFIKQHAASVITFYELLFGVLCISVYLVINGDFNTSFFTVSKIDWYYLIILASVCTAYAFIASIHVMKWLSPYTVMLTTNLEPVYGILLALLILGDKEYMSNRFYVGAAIILITVLANGFMKMRKKTINAKSY